MAKKKRKLNHGSKKSTSHKVESTVKLKNSFLSGREGVILFSLVVLAFLIYSNTLKSPFVFDDFDNIRHNPHIRLTKLTLEGVTRAGLESPTSNRPVANISFALNYYFHRYRVLGYHLVNILIHTAAGFFLYLLVKTTINLPSLRSKYEPHKWIPLFTALIWLVHPVQTQSVNYIVQRMNSMAAMFYVLSLLLYARARLCPEGENKRKWSLFAGCVLSGLLAVGSKEIGVTLPVFIFLYEWYFFQDLSWTWLRRQLVPLTGMLILLVIVAWVYLGSHPLEKLSMIAGERKFTTPQRVLTELRVVIFYISLLALPHPSRLNLDHDFPLSHSLTDPITTLLSLALIAGLIALAYAVARKQRLLSFCIFWFFGNLVIESSVIGIELIYEHRTYLPSMMVSMMVVFLVYRYVRLEWVRVTLLSASVILLAFWTYERNTVWDDDLTLWRDCAEKSPNKVRPRNNLGNALVRRGDLNEAIVHYNEVLRIEPDCADAHMNMGVALGKQGKLDRAVAHLSEAIRIRPSFAEAYNNLGTALANQGMLDEAIGRFLEALRIKPDYPDAHNNLGSLLAGQGKVEEAIGHFSEAFRIRPDYAEAYFSMGNALVRQGKFEEAAKHFSEAVRIKPDYAQVHNNLATALVSQGKLEESMNHYYEALRIKPDSTKTHNNLGLVLASQGKLDEAVSHFSEALRIKPNYAKVHNNLGAALVRQGKIEEAVSHFSAAVRIKPDYADAHNNLGTVLASQGKIEEAMGHFSAAVRIKPDYAEARRNLEHASQRIGKSRGTANTGVQP